RDLRRSIIFGRHDLVQDAPISRVDLLVCRNTLMYFNAETQSKIMGHFHFALNDGGVLLLGKAEMLFSGMKTFAPLDLKRRVCAKVSDDDGFGGGMGFGPATDAEPGGQFGNHTRMREAAFDAGAMPQLLVDRKGFLARANQAARQLFGLTPADIGRRFQDL